MRTTDIRFKTSAVFSSVALFLVVNKTSALVVRCFYADDWGATMGEMIFNSGV
ncbi:MAG: hypothetical protein O3B01_02345 [Planctomycetota bacterium]|nr:hypothetical protein [Planctomycetota bacterium]